MLSKSYHNYQEKIQVIQYDYVSLSEMRFTISYYRVTIDSNFAKLLLNALLLD